MTHIIYIIILILPKGLQNYYLSRLISMIIMKKFYEKVKSSYSAYSPSEYYMNSIIHSLISK